MSLPWILVAVLAVALIVGTVMTFLFFWNVTFRG